MTNVLDAPGPTTRLNAKERAAARSAHVKTYGSARAYDEPALGTLGERLDTIIRRQGGEVRPLRMTKSERAEYHVWLAEEAIENLQIGA